MPATGNGRHCAARLGKKTGIARLRRQEAGDAGKSEIGLLAGGALQALQPLHHAPQPCRFLRS